MHVSFLFFFLILNVIIRSSVKKQIFLYMLEFSILLECLSSAPSQLTFKIGLIFAFSAHILKSNQLVHSTKLAFFSMICYMHICVTVWKIHQYFHFFATLVKKVIFYYTHWQLLFNNLH